VQAWLDAANAHPPVRRALDPWRAASKAWLSQTLGA
jgi:hypothetical protein